MNLTRVRIEGDGEIAALLRGTIELVKSGNLDGARPLLDYLEDNGDRQAPRLRHLYDKLTEHTRSITGNAHTENRKECAICKRGDLRWFIARFDGIAKALASRTGVLRQSNGHSTCRSRL